ncbi:autotransporter outer membrane beta-barrel domain-containing protein [Budvicia aquatica]|uniref:autotransporter outer membrane beta-barrel domain-containing protein n=1 Tax=Budvicia aquatica TaxID=82979 RepID=UPI002081CE6E|nr:autotransporter outer membrane beta-barrel domain-containing protein [Budvicia aquatica]GKX52273.1 hypothetical protein SOASR029_25820 [Budvicia aquatica]
MNSISKKVGVLIFLSCPVTAIYAADNCTNTVDIDGKKHLTCTEVIYYYNPSEHGGLALANYDSVTINTTTAAKTSPLQGWGIYGNSSTYNFRDLSISTIGSASDGIITKNGKSIINIDNFTAITSGSSADGINIGRESSGSIVTINGNADVSTKNGMGIRSNTTYQGSGVNTIIIKGDTSVTTEGSGSAQTGYAVYAGHDSIYGANDSAKIDLQGKTTILTTGKNAYGVYSRGRGYIRLNDADITTTNTAAHGIYASAYSGVLGNSTSYGGIIDLLSDVKVTVNNDVNAIYASGANAKVASYDTEKSIYTSGIYTITGNISADKKGVVDLLMVDNSNFTGMSNSSQYTTTTSGVANTTTDGIININIAGVNSIWNMTDNSVLSNLTLNGSTLKYAEPVDPATFSPKTLTIAGNYTSNDGILVLNTVLEDDTSATDKLIVKGDTSGHTNVIINNIGGNGALTTQGIEIVQVEGNSAGTFNNSGRIVAGAFDYFVRSGTTINGANANNWYLISDYSPVTPPVIPPVEPTPAVPELPVIKPIIPESPAVPVVNAPVYRPEAGSYLANQSAANTLFMTRLHDRLGETQYTDVLTGEQKITSMWIRNVGGHNRFRDGSGQLRTTSDRYVLQLGGDIAQWSNNDLDRLHLGVMAGYGSSNSKTQSKVTDYASKGKVDGYSVGIYGTWYANEADKTGVYVDSWALYNWFDNEVKGDYLGTENYKSRGVTASLESGYSFKLGQNEQASYWLQPKAQVVWMGVSANDRQESNGTGIKHETDNNLMTRLGLRAYMNGHNRIDNGKDRTFQPFIEANWIHNTENYTVKMNSVSNSQAGAKNIGELKVGVEGQLNTRLNLWGNVAQQVGDKGYSDTQAMLGIKYSF